jgi:hypothetical protein
MNGDHQAAPLQYSVQYAGRGCFRPWRHSCGQDQGHARLLLGCRAPGRPSSAAGALAQAPPLISQVRPDAGSALRMYCRNRNMYMRAHATCLPGACAQSVACGLESTLICMRYALPSLRSFGDDTMLRQLGRSCSLDRHARARFDVVTLQILERDILRGHRSCAIAR